MTTLRSNLLRRLRIGRLAPLVLAAVLLNGCWYQPGWGPGRTGHNPEGGQPTVDDVATLDRVWSIDVGASPVLDPVSSAYSVHVVSGHTVTTIAAGDGSIRWSYVADLAPRDTVGSPSLAGDRLYVPIIRYDPPNNEYLDGISAILDTVTGDLLDTAAFGDNNSIAIEGRYHASIARVERGVDEPWPFVTVNLTYGFYGYPAWRTGVTMGFEGTPTATAPALGPDRIVFGLGRQVEAFTRTEPERCEGGLCPTEWEHELGGTATTPAVLDETVFVGDSSGGVSALSLVDGSLRWAADLGGDRSIVAPLTVGDGQLYVTSSDGRLSVFPAEGCGAPACMPTWSAEVGGTVEKQPALAGGVLYVGTADGELVAFDAAGCGTDECDPLWSADTGSRITGAPIVSNGQLMVGTEDGRIIAYRPS